MIAGAKRWAKAHWPRLRLRTIVFVTLFTVAALPGVAAMFLRVYENTLVRQTEAELVAQGAAIAAVAADRWPGAPRGSVGGGSAGGGGASVPLRPEAATIDLSRSAILPERPAPARSAAGADPAAIADAQAVAPIVARTKQVTLSAILLLDRAGRIAAPGPGHSLIALPEVRSALAGNPATVLRRNGNYRATYRFEWLSRAAALRVHHARPIVVDGRVVGAVLLSRSARSLFKGIYEDRGKIAFGVAAIFAVLVVLSGVLSRGVVRPVEALGRATRALAGGHGAVPPPPATAAIEIQGLYADFATMAEAIEARSRYLRDFAHAMSHEFKTPLTGIRGALEILADHGDTMPAADRARFIANADADAARLQLLTSRLLDLARADMTGPGADSGDLAGVLRRLADGWRTPQFAVTLDLPAALPRVALGEASLDAVVSPLIGNARQAGAGGIVLRASVAGEAVELTASDDGPGIPPADRARIFEPFFTTRRAEGGSGLGLPIVRSLLATVGGTLELVDAPAGTTFRVLLPRAR